MAQKSYFETDHYQLMTASASAYSVELSLPLLHTYIIESSVVLQIISLSLAIAVGKFPMTFALGPSAPSPFLTASTSIL